MSDHSTFDYGEVRRVLLYATAERPRHGHELIRATGARVVRADRGDPSPETVRRLETELNRAHEAIARRLGRP